MTFFASLRGPESREGMTAFAEKRSPEWVPEKLRTGKRLEGVWRGGKKQRNSLNFDVGGMIA